MGGGHIALHVRELGGCIQYTQSFVIQLGRRESVGPIRVVELGGEVVQV